ncbi:histidine kinase [Caballeronia fortuita]|uniref:histidine kinase n=1 Tax=Caballeronia fortuita TaxID=1777138 RepID=A0A157ZQ29_9BURK|nr:hybrid sensor histidine kinase/response regulator [Caballeronia fortuita]SAK47596.1 histidine kinase [Caballeronia fortuita]
MNNDRELPVDAYQIVFQLLPSPCLLLNADADFTILDANDAYLRETVSARADLIGRPVFDAFPDSPADHSADQTTPAAGALRASLQRVIRLRRTDAMALQRYDVPDRANGDGTFIERYWSPINIPFVKADGSVSFIIHRVENVSDFVLEVQSSTPGPDERADAARSRRVESESELIRRSRQLSNTNQELRRLSEEAFALAAQLRDESIRKDEFLAMLGHELRNPLAGLASAFQVIDMKAATERAPPGIGALINRQIATLTRLVDDLLDASRVARGAIRLHREAIDLRIVIEAAAYSVRREFEAKGHALAIDLAPGDYATQGDATRLQQIVANLLSNAVKFTRPGGTIRMRLAANKTGDARRAVLVVEDNGRGIPARFLESIFDLFTQVDTTLDRSEGGLGIGLNLARRLVELHGGTLVARSDGEGKGSQFIVELPLCEASVEPAPKLGEHVAGFVDEAIAVLLVEDNEDVRLATSAMLDALGYAVSSAADGGSGLEAMTSGAPALAIVDIGLPDIDGFEVARRARATLGERCPRLVALSGYSGPDVTERALDSGFDEVFVKPIDIRRLQQVVQTARLAMASL